MSCLSGRRSLRLFFIVAALLLSFALPTRGADRGSARAVRITIPAVVYMADNAFTLGEAADIQGPVEARSALSGLILSSRRGELSREQVLQAVEGSGLQGLRIELSMPKVVRVELPGPEGNGTETPPLPSDVSLASMIKSMAAWDGEVEVSASGAVPEGRLVAPASMVPGTPAATLRFQGRDGRLRSLAVRMIWRQNVMVAARNIRRGDRIVRPDLMTRLMQINRPGVYAERPEQVLDHVSRKALDQGEPIPLELLTASAVVKKGRSVRIVARWGGLTATTDGVLLEDGEPGDLVRVRRADNKKTVLKAYIVNENTVEVKVP